MNDYDENEYLEVETEIEELTVPAIVSDLESKGKRIMESNLSDEEKTAYMIRLGLEKDSEPQSGITFSAYTVIRKIPRDMHEAMRLWPKAVGISLADLKQWDEIFKDF